MPAAANRNHKFNEPAYGSKPASYLLGQPRRTGPTERPAVSACRRFSLEGWGALQSPLKNWLRLAAAGTRYACVEMPEIGIFSGRSNKEQKK